MSKRKCETCRFFREAGLAGSGWCHHPERRSTTNNLIMVRRGELACRNGWDEDLWTPKLQAGDRSDSAGGEWLVRPETPATGAELAAVARLRPASEPPPPAAREDVVVGQGPVMPSPDDRVGLLAYDTHTALLEARERARRRQAAQAAAANATAAASESPVSTDGAASDDTAAADGSRAPEEAGAHNVVVSSNNNIENDDRSRAGAGTAPDADRIFDHVPEAVADIELPVAQPRPSRLHVASASVATPETVVDCGAAPPWYDRPAGGVDMRRHRLLQEVLERRSARARPLMEPTPERPAGAEMPAAVTTSDDAAAPPVQAQARAPEDGPARGGPPAAERGSLVRQRSAPAELPALHERWDGGALDSVDDDEPWDDPAADDILDDPADEVFDGSVDVAPEVPRMCRTCRDFRPAEAGDRGWCTNTWAFSHRRMVYEDELPCLTSLGCWWLPHDDVWLAIADISAHSQPTPLVDRWLNEEGASVGGMRGRSQAKR